MEFREGQKIHNLTLERLIGEGATAHVWKAVNSLGDSVAVKLFKENYTPNKTEVLTQHKAQHPNIIKVFSYHDEDFPICIEMEYAEQGTLQKYVEKQKQIQPEEAVNITIDIAKALQTMHKIGIIHRDIKPSNILFADKVPKLSDFGIAKTLEEEIEHTLLTKKSISGTAHFTAPESFDKIFTKQSDIYSLGATMYFMLTGKIPSGAIDSPSEYNSSISKSLDKITVICLKNNPKKRFQNISELIDNLVKVKDKKRIDSIYEFNELCKEEELQNKIKDIEKELALIKKTGAGKKSFLEKINKLIPSNKTFRTILGASILAPVLLFGTYKGCSCLDQSANINYVGYSVETDKLVDIAMPAIKERGFREGFLCQKINSACWSPDKKKLAIYTTRHTGEISNPREGLFIVNSNGTNTYEILRGGKGCNIRGFYNITWIDEDSIYLCCTLEKIKDPFTSKNPYIQIDFDPILNIVKDIKEYKPQQ